MVGESNQNVFLIHIDASSFAEFEISEFEMSRIDCIKETRACACAHFHSTQNVKARVSWPIKVYETRYSSVIQIEPLLTALLYTVKTHLQSPHDVDGQWSRPKTQTQKCPMELAIQCPPYFRRSHVF